MEGKMIKQKLLDQVRHVITGKHLKYANADRKWGWQYVFPANKRSIDPRTGIERVHHIAESVLQRAVKAAIRRMRYSLAKAESGFSRIWTLQPI